MKFTYAPEMRPLEGYTIKRAIDRGSFGEVYYALSDSGKEVALKLLQHNADVELRGIAQCLNLKHPNLVTLFDVRHDNDNQPWLVMEYVAGKSLEQSLTSASKGMSLEEIDRWFPQMCAGAAYLHDRGIVHRDLKPANIFQEQGTVKIGDVGLAKTITPSHRSAQTESVGTVYYMAPEVARGKYGSEIDVYSLGVMLYEMLSGQVPFNGESTGEILMKHLTERPDLNKVPLAFRPLIARALAKDPAQRTPSALQLAKDFKSAMSGKQVAYELTPADIVGRKPRSIFLNDTQPPVRSATPPAPRNERRPHPRTTRAPARNGFPAGRIALFVGAFIVFGWMWGGVGARGSFGELAILGGLFAGLGWGTWALLGGLGRMLGLTPVPEPSVPGRPATPVTAQQRRQHRILTPETLRAIPLAQRAADLTASMTKAALWTAVVTAAIAAVTPLLAEWQPESRMQSLFENPSRLGLFAFTTLIASWTLLLPSKLMWEGSDSPSSAKRLILTALGAGVGACAFWVHDLLLVDSMTSANNAMRHAMFETVGYQPLQTEQLAPTLAGYVVFFSLLFGMRRWWWHTDSFRNKQVSIGSAAFTVLLGFFVPAFFAFPQDWGAAWAGAISLVVQFSSGWVPVQDRPGLIAGPTAVVAAPAAGLLGGV